MLGSTSRYRVYVCHGAHCPGNGAATVFAELERLVAAHNLADDVVVRPGNCNKLCQIGPSLMVHPGAVRYAGLAAGALEEIVVQHLAGDRPVERWRQVHDRPL